VLLLISIIMLAIVMMMMLVIIRCQYDNNIELNPSCITVFCGTLTIRALLMGDCVLCYGALEIVG